MAVEVEEQAQLFRPLSFIYLADTLVKSLLYAQHCGQSSDHQKMSKKLCLLMKIYKAKSDKQVITKQYACNNSDKSGKFEPSR